MDRQIIEQIIKDGVCGISGDNSQPWRFDVSDSNIRIFNIPDRDNPILNVRQRGSYVAHGSLIENIVISASQYGFSAQVNVFPNENMENLVAEIKFLASSIPKDPLYSFIRKRSTNRKPYEKIPLTQSEKDFLIASANAIEPGKLKFLEDGGAKKIVGKTLSTTEKIALTTKALHRTFFKDMVWTEKEEKQKKHGLYIKTLELPPPIALLFRIIRHWPAIKFLNFFGFYKLAASGNAQIYASSGAFGIILAEDNDKEFVTAGRMMQRVWLSATKLGLYMQPVTGVLFLHQRVNTATDGLFSRAQADLIKKSYNEIADRFGVDKNRHLIAMLFRIGRAAPPSAKSSRMDPVINFKNAV